MSSLHDVLLVTPWKTACGIAEHSSMLVDAIEAQSALEVGIVKTLDPDAVLGRKPVPIVHLNYHAALHSQWTPAHVEEVQRRGSKVVITYHDTGVPNSDQCHALYDVADEFIVHEPAADLPKAHYWRMGVEAAHPPAFFNWQAWETQPILGTVGFPFPWKNYDELAKVTRKNGWAFLVIAPGASEAQVEQWEALNPHCWVYTEFTPRAYLISLLAGCDATAFTYVCHNTGQSGAILQGIAARKPVIALSTCRQFRALYGDPLAYETIRWAEDFDNVGAYLREMPLQRTDPGIVALAHQESWAAVAARYLDLYGRLR